MPCIKRSTSTISMSGRTSPGVLSAAQEDGAGLSHIDTRDLNLRALGVLRVHHCSAHAATVRTEVHLQTQPIDQCVEGRRSRLQLLGALTKLKRLVEEGRFEQVLASREMSIQRSDPDAGVASNVLKDDVTTALERRRHAPWPGSRRSCAERLPGEDPSSPPFRSSPLL